MTRSPQEAGAHHHRYGQHARGVRTGHPILDIGDDAGAVVFYTSPELCWQEVEIAPADLPEAKTHTDVTERLVAGTIIYTGVFPPLPAGDYRVCRPESRTNQRFTIAPGQVTEVDWRC